MNIKHFPFIILLAFLLFTSSVYASKAPGNYNYGGPMNSCEGLNITDEKWNEICKPPTDVKINFDDCVYKDGADSCGHTVSWTSEYDNSNGKGKFDSHYRVVGQSLDTGQYLDASINLKFSGKSNEYRYDRDRSIAGFVMLNRSEYEVKSMVERYKTSGFGEPAEEILLDKLGSGLYSVTCGLQEWEVNAWSTCPCPDPKCGDALTCDMEANNLCEFGTPVEYGEDEGGCFWKCETGYGSEACSLNTEKVCLKPECSQKKEVGSYGQFSACRRGYVKMLKEDGGSWLCVLSVEDQAKNDKNGCEKSDQRYNGRDYKRCFQGETVSDVGDIGIGVWKRNRYNEGV